MKISKIENYFGLASTTVLGVLGVVTSNSELQVLAFFPSLICQITSDLKKHIGFDKSIEQDWKSLIKEVCDDIQKKLSQISSTKSNFWKYSRLKIENSISEAIDTVFICDIYSPLAPALINIREKYIVKKHIIAIETTYSRSIIFI